MKYSSRRNVGWWLLLFSTTLLVSLQFTGLVRLSRGREHVDTPRVVEQSHIQHREDAAAATTTTTTYVPHGACSGYDGVLYISSGDQEGAAGTIFFLFVLNQIIYAEKFNLIPWIHLNNVSRHVYDPVIHASPGTQQDLEMMCGKRASWESYKDQKSLRETIQYPGKPVMTSRDLSKCNITVQGNGVWSSYFEPASKFAPDDPSCTSLPLIRLTYSQIIPGLHNFAPWALRAWRYRGLPPSRRQMNKTYTEWFAPMRNLGHTIVEKYVRFLPYLRERAARQIFPSSDATQCLALHIRHSDKANRRRKIPVASFLPYANAYYNHQRERGASFAVYLATDSSNVLDLIRSTWPPGLLETMRWQSGNVVRSNDTTAVFQMVEQRGEETRNGHHQTNVEVLTDILAMSKCQYLLHGLSAVTEAVHYLNPNLHNNSVNLDDQKKDLISVAQFQGEMLKRNGAIHSLRN